MREKDFFFTFVEWGKLVWEKTPYQDVFISKIKEENDPDNPKIPKYTVFALKLGPGAAIPLHEHIRKTCWTETIVLPKNGQFEIQGIEEEKIIKTAYSKIIVVHPGEFFGLINKDSKPLCFYSRMQPGFTGYGEIKEAKKS